MAILLTLAAVAYSACIYTRYIF